MLSCFSSFSVVWAMMSPTFQMYLSTSINVIKIIPYRPSQKLPNLGNPSLTQSRNTALGTKFGIFSPLEMREALLVPLPNSALLSGYPQHSLTWWHKSRTSMTNYDPFLINDDDALHSPAEVRSSFCPASPHAVILLITYCKKQTVMVQFSLQGELRFVRVSDRQRC